MKNAFISKIKEKIALFFQKSFNINYIFYSLFLIVITFCTAFKTNALFTLYSILQALALLLSLIFIQNSIKPKLFKKIFIGFSFFLLLSYMANFIILSLINQNLIFVLNLFLSGGFKNILVTFRAINLNFTMYLLMALAITLLPLLGIFLYSLTDKLCQKNTLRLKKKHLFTTFLYLVLALISIDVICKFKNIDYIYKNQKRLPLAFNFLSHNKKQIFLSTPLKPIRDEKKLIEELNKKEFHLEHKPNIFIFVTEALRKDYITDEIAPNIYSFANENTCSESSYSASNTTYISWYSIFHSNHPIYWSKASNSLEHGSLPLHILKKMGYKINVFSSAELQFFNLDKLLFGKNESLVDNFNDFSTLSPIAAIRDMTTIKTLKKTLKNKENNNSNVFIIFLDSTHSEYSWLDDFKPKFKPYAKNINYLALSISKSGLEPVKNRYKNAINYIDSLFGKFITSLKKNNLYKDSIIVFTADHGEEFFEKGSIFHACHLNDYQLRIPLIYKLINNEKKFNDVTTHIDIFPTIFSEIMPEENLDIFFDGRSIFDKNRKSYILSANQRGNFDPNELLITNNQMSLHGKINNSTKHPRFDIEDFQNIDDPNIDDKILEVFKDLIQ